MQCSPLLLERTKPLLGTFVSVRIHGLESAAAAETVKRCFAEMTEIHRLMSFQESTSDVTRLNREAYQRPIRVDARTYDVLELAGAVSRQSHGTFDITTASDLPGSWTDVVLLADRSVVFRRPLRIDLSGIAKGYAVDRAIAIASASAPQACVNAGGDLRICGEAAEWVRLGVELSAERVVPMIKLRNEGMASSGSRNPASDDTMRCAVTHFDGVTRRAVPTRLVSVVAATCAMADALTKVVTVRGTGAAAVLRHFGAHAVMSEADTGWREVA